MANKKNAPQKGGKSETYEPNPNAERGQDRGQERGKNAPQKGGKSETYEPNPNAERGQDRGQERGAERVQPRSPDRVQPGQEGDADYENNRERATPGAGQPE